MKLRIGASCFSITLTCLFFIVSIQARAAQELYEVEMVVFSTLDSDAVHAELWPINPGAPDFSKGRRLKTKENLLAENKQHAESLEATLERESPLNHMLVEDELPVEQMGFVILPKSHWKLSDPAKKLGRQYQVLLHSAWRQPITETTQAIYFQGGKAYHSPESIDAGQYPNFSGTTGAYEFEGLLKLRKNRFLHAEVDFILQEPAKAEQAEDNATSHSIWLLTRDNWRPDANTQLQSFRLQQSRKMRSKELHYLDHPAMGVLIQISPIDQDNKPSIPKKLQNA
jgi:hypothetical protein